MFRLKSAMYWVITAIGYHLRLFHVVLALERVIGRRRAVVCVCYHNIEDGSRSQPISDMEKGTLATTFEAQVSSLARWLTIIDDRRLADWLDDIEPIQSDSLLITFDDGYLDNRTRAYPILQRYNATGVIFVATNYIESRSSYWWIRLSDVMRQITPEAWRELQGSGLPMWVREITKSEDLTSWESRCTARRKLAMMMDSIAGSEQNQILARLEDVARSATTNSMPLLSWYDIEVLNATGIRFGAHTHTHPRLSQLPTERIREEIQVCGRLLSSHLGEDVCSLAYPSGDYDVRVIEEMKTSQFRLGFTTNPGLIVRGIDRYELPRFYLSSAREADHYYFLVAAKLAKYLPKSLLNLALRLASC